MASERARRLFGIAKANEKNDSTLEFLNTPSYETTKGTLKEDRERAIRCKDYNKNTDRNIKVKEKEQEQGGEEEEQEEQEPFIDSGSEYVPSSNHTTDSETENDIFLPVIDSLIYNRKDIAETSENEVTSSTDKVVTKKRKQKFVTSSEDNEKNCIRVNHSKKVNNKRFRDKRHACYFCHKLIQNMSRHFETIHKDELTIIKISVLPKNSNERRKEYSALIKAGDFYHNCEVLASNSGELILVRNPTENEVSLGVTYRDYGPCPKCLGFMLKRHIWYHVKYSCAKAKVDCDDEEHTNSRHVMAESGAIISGIIGSEFSVDYKRNIIEKIRQDDIGTEIKEDISIMRYGAFLYEKYGETQLELIRQSMRQLSRFLLEIKKINPFIKNISDTLNPEYFDQVIEAIKNLCLRKEGGIEKRPQFGIPSLALKIGHALKKCIAIERGQALRRGDIKKDKSLTSFQTLLQLEWNVRISSNALSSLYSRKLNNTELLPLTDDLLVLSKFLDVEMKSTKISLEENCSMFVWSKLASLTLAKIVLFNKRRSGEAARMTMEQYSSRPSWGSQGSQVIEEALSPFERELAKKLILVNIVGKRGRHVPVILTPEIKDCIDVLIKFRNVVEISPRNPFLFALGNDSVKNMRGHDALKRWCLEANVVRPDLITGTKLRKYIATVCQIFNLTENQTDWLARHLGHDIRVHREFYRLHDNAVELAKVSRLLIAVDQGEAKQFAGKNLDEISVKDLPEIREETGFSSDEEEEIEEIATDSTETIRNKDVDVQQNIESGSPNVGKKRKCRNNNFESGSPNVGKKRKCRSNTKTSRKMWSEEQSSIVLKTFKHAIKNKRLPGKADCEKLISENPGLFQDRKWTDIKFYIKNHLSKLQRLKNSVL